MAQNKIRLYEGESIVTSPFGPRYFDTFHYGEDQVGLTSKVLITPVDGIVVSSQIILDKSNKTWEWGNYVKIDDLYDHYIHFCHMYQRLVTKGQTLCAGQIIGIEGNTGLSKGNHLHFEVRRKNGNVSINPQEYFKLLLERNKIMNLQEALQILKDNGIISSVEPWKTTIDTAKYFENLILNTAKALNSK